MSDICTYITYVVYTTYICLTCKCIQYIWHLSSTQLENIYIITLIQSISILYICKKDMMWCDAYVMWTLIIKILKLRFVIVF